ncbi:hypothetical protein [Sporomusa aerivorans]|uniref:hypothetical protein n=1 Tax=Sporomusa aerivorans TaxID=204936 RepID=UPI00352B426B
MNNRKISITFCGGCNPRIDRGKVAAEVRAMLQAGGCQIGYNSLDADFVIYISGCTANCAFKYNHVSGPFVQVAAATVDAAAVREEELAAEIVTKVRHYFA